jgi:hypothetical protein
MFNGAGRLGCWQAARVVADAGDAPRVENQDAAQIARGDAPETGSSGAAPALDVSVEPDVSDWLTVNPGGGSLSANNTAAISLQASGFETGDQYGLVLIGSTDPDRVLMAAPVALAVNRVPSVAKQACGERPGGYETEPNNSFGQANGICIGVPVKGSPNDASPAAEFDYFTFQWDAQGTLQVDLNNFVPDAQLILYKGTTELPGKDFTPGPGNSYQVTYGGAAGPGTYNVLVLAGAGHPTNTGDYTLTATVK